MFVTDLELVLKFSFAGITRTRKTFSFPSENPLRCCLSGGNEIRRGAMEANARALES